MNHPTPDPLLRPRQHNIPFAQIRAVSCAVPQNEIFNEGGNERQGKAVGVASRRHVDHGTTFLDLAARAAEDCLRGAQWVPADVDALVVVTQSQPRRIPSISCELHQRLGLPSDAPAFDVGLACSGYVYGLWIAGSLRLPRVLLVVGDTISRFLDHADSGTYPIFGDAVSATLIEQNSAAGGAIFALGTDGKGAESLRTELNLWHSQPADFRDAVEFNCGEHLRMKGQDVFDFAISTVPALVEATTMNAHVDWFLFHQANAMMVKHIGKKARVPPEKMPMNMERYGNTSSASIPLLMCDSACTPELRARQQRVAMFGFGAGFSYGGVLMDVGPVALNVVQV